MRVENYVKNMLFYQGINNRNKETAQNNNTAIKEKTYEDTFTISKDAASIKEKAKNTSTNRQIDNSIDFKSYMKNTDIENQKSIDNADAEIKAQNKYVDEGDTFGKILTDKYTRLAAIAKSYSNPEEYLTDKYFNKNSENYASDLTDEEREVGFTNEIQMITLGHLSGYDIRDSAFRELRGTNTDNLLSMSKSSFDRNIVNNQVKKMFNRNGLTLTDNDQFSISINPYTYKLDIKGNVDNNTLQQITAMLETGSNSEELFKHIIINSLNNDNNNKKITDDGKLKFNLYHQCYNVTGIDIRNLNEKNGSYYTKDNKNIIDIYNDAVDKSVEYGNSYMPAADTGNYKKWFSDLVRSVSSKGWNNMKDMYLDINLNKKGFENA